MSQTKRAEIMFAQRGRAATKAGFGVQGSGLRRKPGVLNPEPCRAITTTFHLDPRLAQGRPVKHTLTRTILVVFLAGMATVAVFRPRITAQKGPGPAADLPPEVAPESPDTSDRGVLRESLGLGTRFMLNNQLPAGNFTYQYDWRTRQYTDDDNQVRQAGATWGLTLVYQFQPSTQLEDAIRKALAFFRSRSKAAKSGDRRWIVYPGDRRGSMGTVALVALAHVDYLRAAGDSLPDDEVRRLTEDLNGYLAFLLQSQRPDGLWHSSYDLETGEPFGNPSPYADGEALLALVKAARYLGRDELWKTIIRAADVGHSINITWALALDPDSSITKGYYQWSSMAFFEIATSDRPGVEKYGTYVIDLADWMIDVHRTLYRDRNTAYAYEGIIHAYELARRRDMPVEADKFHSVIVQGLRKLTSWQVGSSIANSHIKSRPTDDPKAIGGVQNHGEESLLRVDVVQHQMHAVVLALKYVFPPR